MHGERFFDESKEQSRIKAAIVAKYFWAWAKIMSTRPQVDRIAYIDLFAGPGRYKDGTKSTPIHILERAIKDEKFRDTLVTVFNDVDVNHVQSLENEINSLKNIQHLKHRPEVMNEEIGVNIVEQFESFKLVPTLLFVDPWGYKGLSLRLINSVLQNWGCDCIVFLNYNRINMAIDNSSVREHMKALFGEERLESVARKIADLKDIAKHDDSINVTQERESLIIEELSYAFKDMGGKYVLPFRFRNERGSRTSHHLIFVSKHPLGYTIMKDIMHSQSSSEEQGVGSFEYNPASKRQPLLFSLSRPIDDLKEQLLRDFSGQRTTRDSIFQTHHIDTPYTEKHYNEALKKLEDENKVTFESIGKRKRRKYTYGKSTTIIFFDFNE